MKTASKFFTQEQKDAVVQAIKEAELNTSGEIRVHIENKCKENVLDRTAFIFKKLDMHNTRLRNGVLIYLAFESRVFAIIGDAGIHSMVSENYWDEIKEQMQNHFKNGDYISGLSKGILLIGEKLKAHFPHLSDDTNELPDEISFKKF